VDRKQAHLRRFPIARPEKPQLLGISVKTASGAVWDCTADDRRFLVATPTMALKNSGPEPYTVILNWQAGLKE